MSLGRSLPGPRDESLVVCANHGVLFFLAKCGGHENVPLGSPTVGSVIGCQPIDCARKSIPALAMTHISLGLLPVNDRERQGYKDRLMSGVTRDFFHR